MILSLVKCASYMIKLLLILICCVLGRHTVLNTEVTWNTVLQTGLIVPKLVQGAVRGHLGINPDAQSLLVAAFFGSFLVRSTRKGLFSCFYRKRDYTLVWELASPLPQKIVLCLTRPDPIQNSTF